MESMTRVKSKKKGRQNKYISFNVLTSHTPPICINDKIWKGQAAIDDARWMEDA